MRVRGENLDRAVRKAGVRSSPRGVKYEFSRSLARWELQIGGLPATWWSAGLVVSIFGALLPRGAVSG